MSFGASPEGRTWVGLSAVISAGGRKPSTGGGTCCGWTCGGGGVGGGSDLGCSMTISIGSCWGAIIGRFTASHQKASAATACSSIASPTASGDMRPEAAEGTLAT